jgi:hypothetical protein
MFAAAVFAALGEVIEEPFSEHGDILNAIVVGVGALTAWRDLFAHVPGPALRIENRMLGAPAFAEMTVFYSAIHRILETTNFDDPGR